MTEQLKQQQEEQQRQQQLRKSANMPYFFLVMYIYIYACYSVVYAVYILRLLTSEFVIFYSDKLKHWPQVYFSQF